jgi:protein-tyrosine-phosphatase
MLLHSAAAGICLMARKRILFVCVENSNRSQMAEAFARMHGTESVEAFSAGSQPSGRINPKAVAAMREVGYDLSAHASKSLTEFDGQTFDVAVTMGCGDACPLVRANERVEWNIPDPRDMSSEEFRHLRGLIEEKVQDLLQTLTSGGDEHGHRY